MSAIKKQLKNCEKWKQAEKDLKKFNEMMELIKKYPIKPFVNSIQYIPYTISLYSY